MAGSFTSIWIYLQCRNDLVHPYARPQIATAIRRSLVGPVVYALATAVALFSAPAAFTLFAAAAFFALTGRSARIDSDDTET